MNIGDQVRLHLVERVSEQKARVTDVSTGAAGILLIKGELRRRKDGTISAWVMQRDKKKWKLPLRERVLREIQHLRIYIQPLYNDNKETLRQTRGIRV